MILSPSTLRRESELFHQLGSMLQAGLGMAESVDVITRQAVDRRFHKPLLVWYSALMQGHGVTVSLRRTQWLSEADLTLIDAGERTGNLDSIFKDMATRREQAATSLGSLYAGLAYPLVVLHISAILMPIVQYFVSHKLASTLFMIFGTLAPLYIIGIVFIVALKTQPRFTFGLLSYLPLVGKIVEANAYSRFSSILAASLNSSMHVQEAWTLSARATHLPSIINLSALVTSNLHKNIPPSVTLSGLRSAPQMFRELYCSGEKSGKLVDHLIRLSDYFRDEYSRKLTLVLRLTPIIIFLLVAAHVAFQVISTFSTVVNGLLNILEP